MKVNCREIFTIFNLIFLNQRTLTYKDIRKKSRRLLFPLKQKKMLHKIRRLIHIDSI